MGEIATLPAGHAPEENPSPSTSSLPGQNGEADCIIILACSVECVVDGYSFSRLLS